jgi:hypothetical protein
MFFGIYDTRPGCDDYRDGDRVYRSTNGVRTSFRNSARKQTKKL